MKSGDLIVFHTNTLGPKRSKLGVWLSSRITKWSKNHVFHTVVVPGEGMVEILLGDDEIEVINETWFTCET